MKRYRGCIQIVVRLQHARIGMSKSKFKHWKQSFVHRAAFGRTGLFANLRRCSDPVTLGRTTAVRLGPRTKPLSRQGRLWLAFFLPPGFGSF